MLPDLNIQQPWRWNFLVFLLALRLLNTEGAVGGELATLNAEALDFSVIHRNNVCERFFRFRNNTVKLDDALRGAQVSVLLMVYDDGYVNYDETTGLDEDYPGLAPVLMDELARRAGFTWRESFGVQPDPTTIDQAWTDVLKWGVEIYDVSVDWWAQNLDRLNAGVAFLEEWYDASIILIKLESPVVVSDDISFWNFLRPYELEVWLLTLFTITLSALGYIILEWLGDYRERRSMWEWFMENWYISAINFTQAYEYRPKNTSMRLFGVSMAFWALVMTATYTANLASLLVDTKSTAISVETIEEAAANNFRICTLQDTNSDLFLKKRHPTIKRIQKPNLAGLYDGLHNGECEFAAETKTSFAESKGIRRFNPLCKLVQVGGDHRVLEGSAGFASKADSGFMCSGLIRDVINLHMTNMLQDGFVESAWERELERSQDIDCLALEREEAIAAANGGPNRHRDLKKVAGITQQQTARNTEQRVLKASKTEAFTENVMSMEFQGQRLTWEQMFGVFLTHWSIMACAILLSAYNKYKESKIEKKPVQNGGNALNRTQQTTPEQSVDNFRSIHLSESEDQDSTEVSVRLLKAMQLKMDDLQEQMRWENDILKEQNATLQEQIQQLVALISTTEGIHHA